MTEKRPGLSIIFILFLVLLSILLFFSMTAPVHRWGDASTYYMQISSIAQDHDIQYQPVDLQRAIDTRFDDLPAGLILTRTTSETYFFGKEFSYALFAAPFFALSGIHGILAFNALMFWSMILMGFLYLREKGNSDLVAGGTSFIFFTLSTAFVYIFWIHTEIYNMFLLTLGLFLWTKYYEKPGSLKFLLCSAFIFGLATVSRIPNGLLFLPFLYYEVYSRRYSRALSLFILFLIPILLFYGYFYTVTGAGSFYGGNYSGYAGNYPFMDSGSGEINNSLMRYGGEGSGYFSDYPFINSSNDEASNSLTIDERIDPFRSLFKNNVIIQGWNHFRTINYLNGLDNGWYYFFGRFTGLIWYYPLAAFAISSFLIVGIMSKTRGGKNENTGTGVMENPVQFLIFAGIILNILFFLFMNGSNYFGGSHAVGNRYFWIYPAFLFLIGRVNLKLVLPFLLIALVTVVPIISDPISNSQNPQNHTFVLPYPLFPLENNQVRNLPLWFPQPALQTMSFLYTGSEGGVVPEYLGSNTYSITGTSHWIVPRFRNTDHLTMIFSNTGKEGANVSVISGSYTRRERIDYSNPIKNTIPLFQPDYHSNLPFNEISVSTTSEILMMLVSNETENQEILYSGGWYDEEKDINQSWRWMNNRSTLLVYSDHEQNKSIQFDALSFDRPGHLNLRVDGNNYFYDINPGEYSTITSPLPLHAGYTILQFDAPLECTRPSDNPGLNSNDTRCLSLIVRNMSIIEPSPSTNESETHEILYSYGWFDEDNENNQSWRWMTNHSSLVVYSNHEENKPIQFDAISFDRPGHLNLRVDGNNYFYDINQAEYSTITLPLHLRAGYTTIQFDAHPGCTRPSDNPGLNSNDTRCLSLNVRNMSFIGPLPSTNESNTHEILYSSGWFKEEKGNNQSWRWMTDRSILLVYSDAEQDKTIQFSGMSWGFPRVLTLRGDGYYKAFIINPKSSTSITSSIHLNAGYNTIQFDSPLGCTRPSDIIGWQNNDTRCLSMQVRNMTIS